MNNIEELREYCEEMIVIFFLWYVFILVLLIIILIDRIEKVEVVLLVVNEKLFVFEGYCIMLELLIVGNGVKGVLSGEFFIEIDIICEKCGGNYDEYYLCECCNDLGV